MTPEKLLRIVIIFLFITGLLLIFLSLTAEWLGVDLTPGFGAIQMFQLLLGLTLLTGAGYLQIYTLRSADAPRSLQADIGIRLGATGLVLAYVAGLSDLVGIGTHTEPGFVRPFVGWLQLVGLAMSILLITIGLLLYFTSRGTRPSSSLEFLLRDKTEQ
ncbi:MAG: hypothetical protein KDD89_03440 [Anaerolineales bacterium]|nr:hypothetical protein [Anaerolineales bacterium]